MEVEEQEVHEKVQLMYKQPGCESHQNLPDVLDEIILTLRELSERLTIVEEFCDQVAELENETYGGTN